MSRFLVTFIVLMSVNLTFTSFSLGMDGGNGSGGADPYKIDETAIALLLKGGGLKNAMLSYLKTLPLSQVSDVSVKKTFLRLVAENGLQNDILSSNYTLDDSCKDAFDAQVPASAKIAERGGNICFNVKKLVDSYKGLSQEDMMIKLASLAFHEHAHHFQKNEDSVEQNESEAYLLSAYVQITAKIVQIPLLKWTTPPPTTATPTPRLSCRYQDFNPGSPWVPAKVNFDQSSKWSYGHCPLEVSNERDFDGGFPNKTFDIFKLIEQYDIVEDNKNLTQCILSRIWQLGAPSTAIVEDHMICTISN